MILFFLFVSLAQADITTSVTTVSRVKSSALPDGASDNATQIQIRDRLPIALGQTTASASLPVVLASDQTISVSTGGLTDTQLRASPISVLGPLTDTQLRASSVPVSAASLPLPSNAAQESGGHLSSIDSKLTAPLLIQGGNSTAVKVDGSAVTQPVSAASLPLPSGAATSALQTTGNSTLTTINSTLGSPFQSGGSIGNTSFGISGTLPAFTSTPTFNVGTTGGIALDTTLSALSAKFNSLGQKTMANSAPVALSSDQSAIPVTGTFFQATQPVSIAATVAVSGPLTDTQLRASAVPVTANAGTNLNTSLLALESGGNLAGLNAKFGSLGQKAMSGSAPVVLSSDQTAIPVNATLQAGASLVGKVGIDQTTPGATNGVQVNAALPAGANTLGRVIIDAGTSTSTTALALESGGNLATTATNTGTISTRIGDLTEAAPGSDTGSSGLNGRLQRLAQRLSSLISLLPLSIGQKALSQSLAVVLPTDQSLLPVTIQTGSSTIGKVQVIDASGNPLPVGDIAARKIFVSPPTDGTSVATVLVGSSMVSSTAPALLVRAVLGGVALTPNAGFSTVVGTSSAQALATNASRKGLSLVNTSNNKISCEWGVNAVINNGITLYPGGAFSMDPLSAATSALNCISTTANSILSGQEYQ